MCPPHPLQFPQPRISITFPCPSCPRGCPEAAIMGSSGLWRVFSLHGCSSRVLRVKERALVDYGEQESASIGAQPLPCTGEEAFWSLNGVWDDPSSHPSPLGSSYNIWGHPKNAPRDTARNPSQPAPLGVSLMGSKRAPRDDSSLIEPKKSTQGLLLEHPGAPRPCWSLNNRVKTQLKPRLG